MPVFVNPCASPGGLDDDVAAIDHDRVRADLERGLARFDHEDLGIGMPVQLRPDARTGVHEDHRERHLAVLGANELVRVLGVGEVVELDDRAALIGQRSLPSPRGRPRKAAALTRAYRTACRAGRNDHGLPKRSTAAVHLEYRALKRAHDAEKRRGAKFEPNRP